MSKIEIKLKTKLQTNELRTYGVLGQRSLRWGAHALLAVRPVSAVGVRIRRLRGLTAVGGHIVTGLNSAFAGVGWMWKQMNTC